MVEASQDGRNLEERLLLRAGWSRILERILAGLSHDLNGRVTALRGFLELARLGDAPGPLESFLDGEVERLERLARMLWSIPDAGNGPELMAPASFLEEVIHLHGNHRGLERVGTTLSVGAEAPAFRASRRGLRRALLIALAEVAERALAGGRHSVAISCSASDGEGLVIDLAPGTGAGEGSHAVPGSVPGTSVDREVLAALAELLSGEGIRLEESRHEAGLALRFVFPPA